MLQGKVLFSILDKKIWTLSYFVLSTGGTLDNHRPLNRVNKMWIILSGEWAIGEATTRTRSKSWCNGHVIFLISPITTFNGSYWTILLSSHRWLYFLAQRWSDSFQLCLRSSRLGMQVRFRKSENWAQQRADVYISYILLDNKISEISWTKPSRRKRKVEFKKFPQRLGKCSDLTRINIRESFQK